MPALEHPDWPVGTIFTVGHSTLAIARFIALLEACGIERLADALLVRGVAVVEILSETNWRMHKLTPFAQADGTEITCPPDQATLL